MLIPFIDVTETQTAYSTIATTIYSTAVSAVVSTETSFETSYATVTSYSVSTATAKCGGWEDWSTGATPPAATTTKSGKRFW